MHHTILPTHRVCVGPLPIGAPDAPAPDSPWSRVNTAVESEHILIVEDDVGVAETLAELLRYEGFAVVTASNAVSGLAALRTRQFTLVLSDHRMPGQTGTSMLYEALASGLLDGVAALIVSADEIKDTPWRALRKPVAFHHLLEEVRRALAERIVASPSC
jgi:DNA-binding NtrC family response regulator